MRHDMKLLKCFAFVYFAISWARGIPGQFKTYKEDKSLKNLFLLLGKLIMTITAMIVAVGIYI